MQIAWLARFWAALRAPCVKYSLLTVVGGGFVAGIIFWGGFNTALEATNTLEFCIGCHEMNSTVYPEYKQTIHYSNRTGVRAVCSDCHVPKDWTHKMIRKIEASGEVWGKLTGVIDTPEKFEAKRYELATRAWTRMVTTDSIECRNCHHIDSMDPTKQTEKAQRRHAKAKAEGKTCIECHFGIAHKEPEGPDGPSELKAKLLAGAKK
ncbi:MAG: NapC/NirT family cytochrome c [Sulfuritalea sp.]|nr:NapC/NirT family cytochrome c [Sulfuritalea sp.]MDP1983260.1 NapC/NirT family cytochrome c [Sulfuritalea sp.]